MNNVLYCKLVSHDFPVSVFYDSKLLPLPVSLGPRHPMCPRPCVSKNACILPFSLSTCLHQALKELQLSFFILQVGHFVIDSIVTRGKRKMMISMEWWWMKCVEGKLHATFFGRIVHHEGIVGIPQRKLLPYSTEWLLKQWFLVTSTCHVEWHDIYSVPIQTRDVFVHCQETARIPVVWQS